MKELMHRIHHHHHLVDEQDSTTKVAAAAVAAAGTLVLRLVAKHVVQIVTVKKTLIILEPFTANLAGMSMKLAL